MHDAGHRARQARLMRCVLTHTVNETSINLAALYYYRMIDGRVFSSVAGGLMVVGAKGHCGNCLPNAYTLKLFLFTHNMIL